MSIKLMSLIFECDMPELKTDKGQTVPNHTAKFVLLSLADHANDEGEGSYPSVQRLCKKTNMSTATVCNALNALRTNGFTKLVGKSKVDTNNYTILAAKIHEFQPLKPDDFSPQNPRILAPKKKPLDQPSGKPKQTPVFELDPRWVFELKGDYTTYPTEVQPFLVEFCLLWGFNAPSMHAKSRKNGRAWQWVEFLEELKEASAEFGAEALIDFHKTDWTLYQEEHEGLAPFRVTSPKSLVNAIAGHTATMRQRKNGQSEVVQLDADGFAPEY